MLAPALRLLLAALVLTLVPAPAPVAARPFGPDPGAVGARWFGFNDNSTLQHALTPAQDARLLAQAGANSARITVDWSWVEPVRGKLDLALFDPIYRAWTRAGIRPLLIVTGAPRWAWLRWIFCLRGYDCHVPPDRTRDADWSHFVAAVARRYPLAAAIEVWNEPNLGVFFRPAPDPDRYTELLRLARAAVKSVAPRMPVLGGSLAPVLNDSEGFDYGMGPFLRGMYADGARGLMDGLAVHAYPQGTPGHVAAALSIALQARDEAGDAVPLWVTEVGASTTGGYSDAEQAAFLRGALPRLLASPQIAAVYVHTLVDPPRPNPYNPEHGYGVFRYPGRPKPALRAVQTAFGERAAGAALGVLGRQLQAMRRAAPAWRGG